MKIHIDDLILYKGNPGLEYGVARAFINHENGKPTQSGDQPVIVKYLVEENKYIVLDGYHRIVKGLLEGKKIFNCTFDGAEKHKYWLPPENRRFKLTESRLRIIIRKTLVLIL